MGFQIVFPLVGEYERIFLSMVEYIWEGGVPTKSGKGCERRQIMCSISIFSRGYSRFGLVKKQLTNHNLE